MKHSITKVLLTVMLLALVVSAFAGCGSSEKGDGKTLENAVATHIATIEVEGYGVITAELYGKSAPKTVANFVSLAQSGFYDGLTFHRIYAGFMIQGGDPKANGTGSSDKKITGEFISNGFENNLLHKRGVLSMARSKANDSASCQFFIMHQDAPHLDGDYAAFGFVTQGMEIVDAICADAQPIDGNGMVAYEQQPVIKSITVTEK